MKGTSEHGARFFAETRYPARSLPSARFFMQVSTCMTANAGDARCLQCSQASHSPAVPVEIGGLFEPSARVGTQANEAAGRSKSSRHPDHRLSEGEPTPSRRRTSTHHTFAKAKRGAEARDEAPSLVRRKRRSQRARQRSA